MRTKRILAASMVLLAGCTAPPIMKQSETHIAAQAPAPAGAIPAPVPFSPSLPRPKQIQKPETYSVVVNGVKVHELLFALARDAKLNIDIHNGISGTVTMNAIDQTLPQLLTRISKQVDMRWEFEPPNLIVMPDSPYLRVYKIDYVNMERTSTGTVGISSQISGTGGSGGSSGGGGSTGGTSGGNNSSTTLTNKSSNKFWDTLVDNVKDILRETDKILPTGTAAAPAPAPAAVAQAAVPQLGGPLGAIAGALGGGAAGQPAPLPPPGAPAASAAGAPANSTFREAASVIANAEAGVLNIRATSRQHEKIQEFLDRVLVNARRQVLIEATIVEVQLSNQFQQGINWSLLRRGPSGISISQVPIGGLAATPTQGLFVGNLAAPNFNLGNLSGIVQLLESFGNVRVLSSPKISVLNNQTALLKVVDERVYFNISVSTNATANVSQTTFTTTANTVPVGFVMNVTPQIGDTDIVLLNVRPSLSRIVNFVNDPNPALANPCGIPVPVGGCNLAPIVSRFPEIQRREMESLIKVNSGQVAVMGGLIQESVNDLEDGIPGVRSSEGFGQLFGQRNRTNSKTELVIFFRPVVIRDPSIDGDYRAYRVYAPDENFLNQGNPAAMQPGDERK